MDVSPKQIVSVGHGAHPVPRARRRQPGPHGRQHAEAGRAAAAGRGAVHRHRHRGPRRPRRGRHDPRRRTTASSPRSTATRITVEYKTQGRKVYRLLKFERSNQDTCINQKPDRVRGPEGHEGRRPRRRPLHRQRRARPRQEPARGLHAVGGLQLRGRHHPLRAPGEGRRAHVDPHPRARGRRPRHQARPRGDHPGHPEPLRGDPRRPRRARHHPRRRRGRPRRRAGRQGHPQGRDRAHPRGAPPAGHLRREGPRGARHLAQGAPRRDRQGHRRQGVQPRREPRAAAGRQPAGPGLRRPRSARSAWATSSPAATATRASSPRSSRSRTCPSWPTAPRSTSSSTRSASRPA